MTGRSYLGPDGQTLIEGTDDEEQELEFDELEELEDLGTEPPPGYDEIEPPLVGQLEAAATVHAGIKNAFENGKPTLVVLEGPRGSGKTRMLFHASEVAVRLDENVRILHGACRALGANGYFAPFGRLLLERFGVTPSSSPSSVRGQMATEVGQALMSSDAIEVAETTHLLGHIAGVPFPDSPFLRGKQDDQGRAQRALSAVRRFAEGDAKQRPWLVVLDDMHAAEDDGWEIIEALLGSDAPIAIVVVGDAPISERAEALPEPAGGLAIGPFEPFSEADVASFMQVLLPDLVDAPEPIVAALTHRCEGNPSALRELLLAVVEGGLFKTTPDGLEADVSQLETGALPVTMDDTIRARLARLDPLELETVRRASVVGEVFKDRAVLAQMRAERTAPGEAADPASLWPDDDDSVALGGALERLEGKGFFERLEHSDLPGTVAFRFLHPGTRALVYGELAADVRTIRHRAIAHWLSVVAEIHGAELAAQAAPHLELAGMRARAGRAYLEAAGTEQQKMHTRAAHRLVDKALKLIEAEDIARRIDALHLAGSLLTTLGRDEEARQVFVEMLQVAWRIGARNKGGAALNRLARIHRQRGEISDSEKLLIRALELFRAAGDLRGVASTLDDIAQVSRLQGETDAGVQAATEALEIRRGHGDSRGEAVSLATLASLQFSRGELEQAEQLFQAALKIRETIEDRPGIMHAYNALAVVAFERGDAKRADACWRVALHQAKQMADRHMETYLLNNLGEALTRTGHLDDAMTHLRAARKLAHGLKNLRAMAEIERNLGLAALRRGDDDAKAMLHRSLAMAEEYGTREAIGLAHRAIGTLRAQTLFDDKGEVSLRAEESFLASIDIFREIGDEKEAAHSLAELGHHLIERGENASARERLREARAIMRRIGLGQLEKVETTLKELG